MANFEVGFYETAEGRAPAEEFIDLQNMKMQAKIYREIGFARNAARRNCVG